MKKRARQSHTCQCSLDELLLIAGNLAKIMDFLDTLWAKLNLGCEKVDSLVLVERAFHECRLNNSFSP